MDMHIFVDWIGKVRKSEELRFLNHYYLPGAPMST